MAIKIPNKSAFGHEEAKPITREESLQCQAKGCKFQGGMMSGGKWCCPIHHNAPESSHAELNFLANRYQKALKIVEIAELLKAHEFDALQASGGWQLPENAVPKQGEVYSQWKARIVSSVWKTIKKEKQKIVQAAQSRVVAAGTEVQVSYAMQQLTSGVLLKDAGKTRGQQISEARKWEANQ